jgi:hypothetical protein
MIEHLRRRPVIVGGAVSAPFGTAPTVLAQVDSDRVLAQIFKEWKAGSTAPRPG